jgi:hypothetical protein
MAEPTETEALKQSTNLARAAELTVYSDDGAVYALARKGSTQEWNIYADSAGYRKSRRRKIGSFSTRNRSALKAMLNVLAPFHSADTLMSELNMGSSLKRIAWAYGCAKRGSAEEVELCELLLEKVRRVSDPELRPLSAEIWRRDNFKGGT